MRSVRKIYEIQRGKGRGVKFYNRGYIERLEKHWEKFRRYCIISFICALVLFFLLILFASGFKFYYLFSLFLAYSIAITINFVFNRKYTFTGFNPKKIQKQYYQFFIINLIGFFLNLVSLYIAVEWLGFRYWLGELIIGVIGIPLLYIGHKYLTFDF